MNIIIFRSLISEWTDDEITAQVLLFFIAGFDTSATLLCFLAHELTLHQDVQRRLQEEVDELASTNGGKLNYTDLQSMKYMDMVVSGERVFCLNNIVVDYLNTAHHNSFYWTFCACVFVCQLFWRKYVIRWQVIWKVRGIWGKHGRRPFSWHESCLRKVIYQFRDKK